LRTCERDWVVISWVWLWAYIGKCVDSFIYLRKNEGLHEGEEIVNLLLSSLIRRKLSSVYVTLLWPSILCVQ